jgi:Zn-dependent protease with chaperone function
MAHWLDFSPSAREDFLAAIARHRRSAWRVTAVCAVAYSILGFILAVLLSPLLYGLLGLALDIINRIIPTPDLLKFAGGQLDAVVNAKGPVSIAHIARLTCLAALPGIFLVALAALALRRALLTSPLYHYDEAPGRVADPTRLVEVQLKNTVEEMAIAAMIPAPRVFFIDGAVNGGAFGVDIAHSTILFGAGAGEILTRAQMQGVAGHLVASIANGDMAIGLRTGLTVGVFSLAARVSGGWSDRETFASMVRLLRALLLPTPANLSLILSQLSDPFRDPPDQVAERKARAPQAQPATGGRDNKLTWREWAMMPLMGPIVLSGFLCGLVNVMMLGPIVSLAWRQRKYLADAISVQLTRDPDALDGALDAIARAGAALQIEPWANHLCVVDPGTAGRGGLLGRSFVSIFPSGERRHRALVRLGASRHAAPRKSRWPLWAILVGGLLFTVVGVLLCVVAIGLVYLSAAMAGMFTLLPIVILHAILR